MSSETNLPLALTRGLQTKESEEIERQYKNANKLVKRIAFLLERELDKALLEADDKHNFDKPNWDYLNAHSAGYRNGIRQIKKLLIKE